MGTNYTGNSTPTLSNAPASGWTTDSVRQSHVGNTYLVTGSGGTAGNVYAFEEYQAPVVKTVTGLPKPIVTITDGGNNLAVQSLKSSILPVQSLNGYEYPWAGGAGVNIYPECAISGTFGGEITITQSGCKYTLTGTTTAYRQAISTDTIDLTAGTYTLKIFFSGTATNDIYVQLRSTDGVTTYGSNISNNGVFTLSSDTTVKPRIAISQNVVTNQTISVMLVSGSTAPSTFSPWENLCPITGWTQANVWDDPVRGGSIEWNQLLQNGNFASTSDWTNQSAENKVAFSASGNAGKLTIVDATYGGRPNLAPSSIASPVVGHKYFFSGGVKITTAKTTARIFAFLFGNYNTILDPVPLNAWNDFATILNVSSSQYANGILYITTVASTFNANDTIEYRNIQLIDLTEAFGAGNEPSTVEAFRALFPKDYYAYDAGTASCVSKVNGDPYRQLTFSFGQTVYGVELDANTGTVTVKWAVAEYDGSNDESWAKGGGTAGTDSFQGFYIPCNALKKYKNATYVNSIKCDRLQTRYSNSNTPTNLYEYYVTGYNDSSGAYPNQNWFYVKASNDIGTTADFKAWLQSNPIQVVYELATPTTITLSPQTMQTLLGENNLWADCGEITELKYQSNQFVPKYDWFETWTMPKITRNNGTVIVLPYPQEYTPEIYDVDASTTGRNAAGTMIRDRVARKHKFNYKFPPLSRADATEILGAVQDVSFTLTTASPETGAKTNYRVYVGDRSLPVYWMPTHDNVSWLYSSLSLNLIEM